MPESKLQYHSSSVPRAVVQPCCPLRAFAGEWEGPETNLKGTNSLCLCRPQPRSVSQIPLLQASLGILVRTLGWAIELACYSLALVNNHLLSLLCLRGFLRGPVARLVGQVRW